MPTSNALIFASLPVVFTSFGFHGSIPSIVKYIGKDIKALRFIMITGSALPLVVYILWQLVSHGTVSSSVLLENDSLSAFIKALSLVVNNSSISALVSAFANLALATSFLGVSLGLLILFKMYYQAKKKSFKSFCFNCDISSTIRFCTILSTRIYKSFRFCCFCIGYFSTIFTRCHGI